MQLVSTFTAALTAQQALVADAIRRGDEAAAAAARGEAALRYAHAQRGEAGELLRLARGELAAVKEAMRAKEEALLRIEEMYHLTSTQQAKDEACCAASKAHVADLARTERAWSGAVARAARCERRLAQIASGARGATSAPTSLWARLLRQQGVYV